MAVSFDLFGTLIAVDRPADPAESVGAALAERDVPVPDDWTAAYGEPHFEIPPGVETPLPAHVEAALASRDVDADRDAIRRAVLAAFDAAPTLVPGAEDAVRAAADLGRVAVLSNCSVPGLVAATLRRSRLPVGAFDVVLPSVTLGVRKPDPRAFAATAGALGVGVGDLVHVGDDPSTDGGAAAAGATFVDVADVPLTALPEHLEAKA